jgi:hypothetical protein
MGASTGLRASVLAILAVMLLACTDPTGGAASAGPPEPASGGPVASDAAAPSAAPSDGGSGAPSAPSGPDDYEY